MSEIGTELSRLSAVDLKTDFKSFKGSVSGITNGLKSLGLINDSQAEALTKVNGALSVFTGMLGLVTAVKALQEAKKVKAEAKAVALTGANAIHPIGWGKIATATAVAAATSVALYTTINNINLGSFNLSTSDGQAQAVQAVQEVI